MTARGRGLLYESLSAVSARGRKPRTVFEKAEPDVNILLGDLPVFGLVPFVMSTGPTYLKIIQVNGLNQTYKCRVIILDKNNRFLL